MENTQQQEFTKNGESYISFKFDGIEKQIKTSLLDSSGLIKEIKSSQRSYSQQSLQLVLPKWVNKYIFDIFIDFLDKKQMKIWEDKNEHIPDNILQKLLWIGDYFQVDKFQATIIQEVLIPRIRIENCLQFLNEAFKKLRACEDSQDIWYMLLNTGMNFTAKNLLQIFKKNPNELQKINQKILEEIIERTLKFNKNKPEFDLQEMVKVLLQIKQKSDFLDLITLQNKAVVNKKINFSNHPSISWKLANISSIVNKETNPFKFNDYQWKLAAKMEEAINTDQKEEIQQKKQKTLRIYLKLEKQSKDSKQLLPDENSDEPSKIIAIYFLLKINDHNSKSTLQVKHIIVDRSPQILMCQFHEKEFGYYENKKLEFTVFLNTDYIYSLLLNYFQRNWLQYYHSAKLGQMNLDDLEVIIKATPQNEKAQSEVIKLALEYLKQQDGKQQQDSFLRVFQAICYRKLSPEIIKSSLLNSPVINSNNQILNFIDQQYQKRINEISLNDQSRSRYLSPLQNNITISNDYQQGSQQKIQQSSLNQTDVKILDYNSNLQNSNFLLQSKDNNKSITQSSDQKTTQRFAYNNKYNANNNGGSISPIRSNNQLQKQENYNLNSYSRENAHKSSNQLLEEQKKQQPRLLSENQLQTTFESQNNIQKSQSQLKTFPVNNNQLQNLSNSQNINMNSTNLNSQQDFINNINNQNSNYKIQQNQQDSSSNLHISDTSPIKQTQNQKQIDNYKQINQSASKQNIQQVTSHTNSRIGYSPMTNLVQNQNYNQLNQNVANNNTNLSSNSQLNTQVRKFDPQPLHSKSGIILLNNNLGANINDNREIVGNSNSNIKYTQNSQSDIKQFVTRTPHHIGNKNININSIANSELPVNKFDKIRGNKSLNSQKPNIPLLAGKIDANQNKNELNKNTEDINNSNQVNVDQSSSQIYFRENALGQNQIQQQQNQNQQSLSLQKNSNSQHQTQQSIQNSNNGNNNVQNSNNYNNYSQSGVSYNKSLFNFYPTSQSQQSQNSILTSNTNLGQNNNRSAFNNQNKNLSLSQVSQNIQNYNLQYQPKNNMNRFGSSTNSAQMANNSRLKIPNWQDSLKAEKENRKNQLLKDINIANFIKPDSWLKNAYFN